MRVNENDNVVVFVASVVAFCVFSASMVFLMFVDVFFDYMYVYE